jgi:Domain of unknown function (DUF6456)
MQRRGSITPEMRASGEEFRKLFRLAQLDPLQALDLDRPRSPATRARHTSKADGIGGARDAVWRALLAVGGLGSPCGSCVWHVIGWEQTIKQWALEQGWNGRRVSQEAGAGILIGALGTLQAHFDQTPG